MELSSWLAFGQIASTLAALATFVAYVVQVRIMRDQVSQSANSSRGQTTFAVIQMLQTQEVRKARHILGNLEIANKDFGEWTPEEYEAVRTVCSSYDVAGMMIRAGMVNRDIS